MPIAFRYNHQARADFSLGGDFVVLCDHCGKEIDSETPANAEHLIGNEGDATPVVFLHKECSLPFKIAEEQRTGKRPHRLWANLVSVEVKTK